MARLRPVPEPERRAPDLRVSVAETIKGMTWLGPSDAGLRDLAVRLAGEIEEAEDRAAELEALKREDSGDFFKRLQALEARCDATKTVGWLGPQLQGVLRDLGGTPAARKAMQADKPIGGRLAQMRRDAGEA